MTSLIIPAAEAATRLPPVVIEFVNDAENLIRLVKSRQVWWKLGEDEAVIELWLPVCDSISGVPDVMIPDAAARKYVIKFMNMKAKRMIAAGYRPRLKTQMEEAMIGFATQIDVAGNVNKPVIQ